LRHIVQSDIEPQALLAELFGPVPFGARLHERLVVSKQAREEQGEGVDQDDDQS
jgi:hypothetical protein